MSYIPSSNDDNISYPLNKPNNNRGNIKNSNKYIQPKKINIIGTHTYTKIKNRKLRQKKIIIPTRLNLHKNKNKYKTTKNNNSKHLVNKHRKIRNEPKSTNSDNTNIQDNNNKGTSTHKERYRHDRHNKINDLTRKKKFIEEEKYDSKIFRHLRSIKSRVKKDSDPRNKTIQEQTGTQHKQIRTNKPRKQHDQPKFRKRPKFMFRIYPNIVVLI